MHHPHIPASQSLILIALSIAILLLCYQFCPPTYQGKQTVSGLLGTVVGVVIGLVRLLIS